MCCGSRKINPIIGFFNDCKTPESDRNFHLEMKLDHEYNPIVTPDINILIKNKVVKLESIINNIDTVPQQVERSSFFLLYISKNILQEQRDALIAHFKKEIEEILQPTIKSS